MYQIYTNNGEWICAKFIKTAEKVFRKSSQRKRKRHIIKSSWLKTKTISSFTNMSVSCCQLLAALDEFEPPVQTKWYRADDETIPVSWQQTQSDWTIHVNNHSYIVVIRLFLVPVLMLLISFRLLFNNLLNSQEANKKQI
jgi:hypothetical protein